MVIRFTKHAIERMKERGIGEENIRAILSKPKGSININDRIAIYSTIKNRYILVIVEKDNDYLVITAIYTDRRKLHKLGFI